MPYGARQHRHQHLVRALGVGGRPVDVEEAGVGGRLTVLEHVHPPVRCRRRGCRRGWARCRRCAPCRARAVPPRSARNRALLADLGIEGVMVDHVVAVRAAGAGAEVGRAVDMADAERGQVGHDRDRVAEREAGVELQPVGGPRDGVVGRIRRGRLAAAAARRGAAQRPSLAALEQPQHAPRRRACLRASVARTPGWVANSTRPAGAPASGRGVVVAGSRCRCSTCCFATQSTANAALSAAGCSAPRRSSRDERRDVATPDGRAAGGSAVSTRACGAGRSAAPVQLRRGVRLPLARVGAARKLALAASRHARLQLRLEVAEPGEGLGAPPIPRP